MIGRPSAIKGPLNNSVSHPFLPLLLLLVVFLGGCEAQEPDLVWQRIQEQGVLRVGMDANWVPFEYIDGTGQLSGSDVALAQELGKRLGLEVQYVANLSFDGLYDALTAGLVDAVISAVVVDIRKSADFGYSTPYFDAGQVLVVGSDSLGIENMEDMNGRMLAIELGSDGDTVARRWARRLADLSLLHTDSAMEALAAVADGRAAATLTDHATALMALKAYRQIPIQPPGTNPDAREEKETNLDLHISGAPVTDEQYAIVVRKESRELLRALNEALADMHQDGSLKRVESEWLGP